MEVTFLPGLENLGERLLAKKRDQEARKGETVWDAYMRRKRCVCVCVLGCVSWVGQVCVRLAMTLRQDRGAGNSAAQCCQRHGCPANHD